MFAKGDREREGAAQLRQYGSHRVLGRGALFNLLGHQMRDDLSIGLALESSRSA